MSDTKTQRNTPQRQIVLEELRKVTSHPTPRELYEMVRQRLPRISLGTVYRNLERLHQSGTIQKLELGGSEARFDGRLGLHHHVRCVRCGRVADVDELPGDPIREEPAEAAGYKILGHRFEFVGLCPECREKPIDQSGPLENHSHVVTMPNARE